MEQQLTFVPRTHTDRDLVIKTIRARIKELKTEKK